MKKASRHKGRDKVSKMLVTLGDGFVQLGATAQERENHFRTVATAWNIACLDESLRERCIGDSILKFIDVNKSNQATAEAYEHNLRQLISRKLELFPLAKAQVFDVQIQQDSGQEKLLAVSRRM